MKLFGIRPIRAPPRHQGFLCRQGRIEHGLERVGEDAVYLAGGGRERIEERGIGEERDDRGDEELGLREERREGAEGVDVGRVERESDFFMRLSKLLYGERCEQVSETTA